jgi:hypothetical protein
MTIPMLTNHQDNSQCPGFRVCSGRDTLRGLHRDHSPSCRRSHAALSEALAAHTVDSEAVCQLVRYWSLSHMSVPVTFPSIFRVS